MEQGYTYSGRQVAVAHKFCRMVPNIRWSTVWDLFDVTSLAFRFLGYLCILVLDEAAASIFKVEEPDLLQVVLNEHQFCSARVKRPLLDAVSLSSES